MALLAYMKRKKRVSPALVYVAVMRVPLDTGSHERHQFEAPTEMFSHDIRLSSFVNFTDWLFAVAVLHK